ncbi:hypothetical protein HF325_002349 [Metschnikowia pulcherrima]|uniref:Uncharacterized protein n=1 Tax=Metschnikowia pulcherrima TaxID=27326 RepID=A0A8H7LC81_9ASCO|nr:hypothetical protein HF325_002349 [Metschnikowia pulcherrima]
MKKEVGNCTDAMRQSGTQIHDVKRDIDDVHEKLAVTRDQEERANAAFQRQRDDLLSRVAAAEEENAAAREKFAKALSFLKETSHLKKRKGRGVTPIAR